MSTVLPDTAPFLAELARVRGADRSRGTSPDPSLNSSLTSWLDPIRDAARGRFSELGFPTVRDEEWRKTNVTPISKARFGLPVASTARTAPGATAADIARLSFDAAGCHQIVFVNGIYAPELSWMKPLPTGVVLCRLEEAIQRHRGLVEPFLARLANPADRAFTALNTAFLRDGLFLHLPDEAVVPEPIHLLFVTQPLHASAGDSATMSHMPHMTHPRNLIVCGPSSRATLVESYVGPQDPRQPACFTNAVTEISLARDAVLDHYSFQRHGETAFHVATTQVRQDRSSRFTSHAISLGGALARNDIDVVLAEEGAECTLNGLYMTAGRQQVDFHTTIDHARPNCVSRELYKGVLDGHSRGVFNGKIIVRTDARGTDSIQVNRNLLLSADALVDTKPELQIFNNDVKCKHAAAIGQLDEKALFYLRSRGIGLEAARSLLIHAFVSDIVGRIQVEPLRESLEALLLARLPEYFGVREAAL